MPFESPHQGPPDPDALRSLELEMLADQLRQDASWLAAKYPAHKPALPLRRPQRMKWVAAGAVAVLLLLAVDGWRLWTRPAEPGGVPENNLATTQLPVGSAVPKVRSEAAAVRPSLMETRVPGLQYKDLSGAEKEAVLDLLEERAPALHNTSLPL